MNKKAQLGLGGIVMIFITIIVAIALINPIFNTQSELTNKAVVTNESINIASFKNGTSTRIEEVNINVTIENYPTGWKITDCPIASFVLKNQSGTTLTVTTDYVFTASTGKLALKNTAALNTSALNTTYVSYQYCMDGYNKDGASRSIAGLIGLFAVLALLAAVIVGVKDDWF